MPLRPSFRLALLLEVKKFHHILSYYYKLIQWQYCNRQQSSCVHCRSWKKDLPYLATYYLYGYFPPKMWRENRRNVERVEKVRHTSLGMSAPKEEETESDHMLSSW